MKNFSNLVKIKKINKKGVLGTYYVKILNDDPKKSNEKKAEIIINSKDIIDKINKFYFDKKEKIKSYKESGQLFSKELEKRIPGYKKKYSYYDYGKIFNEIEDDDDEMVSMMAEYESSSPTKKAFMTSEIFDLEEPVATAGWRYGDRPEGGKSHNFRENKDEDGVSMMQIKGKKSNRGFAGLGHKESKTPIYIFIGFSANWLKGSDDENLMTMLRKVEVLKNG